MLDLSRGIRSVTTDAVKALQFYTVTRQLALILISIILAKSVFTTGEIGVYEILLYLGTLSSFFWLDSLIKGFLSHYPELTVKEQKKLIFNTFLLFSGISAVICVLLFFGQALLLPILTGQQVVPNFETYILYLLFYLPSFLIPFISIVRNKPGSIIAYAVFNFTLHVLAIAIPVLLGFSFSYVFIGLVIFGVLSYCWLILIVIRTGAVGLQWSMMKALLFISAPLMLYAVASGLAKVFDSWLVNWVYQDEAVFAVFRYGAREFPLSIALLGAVTAGSIPFLVRDNPSLDDLKKRANRLMHLLFPLSIFLIMLSPLLFPIVFNADFSESAYVFNVYLLLLVSQILLPHAVIFAKKHNHVILISSFIELAVNVILSLILVKYFGLLGIAGATVVAYCFEKSLYIIYVRKKFGIRFFQYISPVPYFFYSGALFGSFVLSMIIWN
jgi:O-antigen/teichoic acid export membrane protein